MKSDYIWYYMMNLNAISYNQIALLFTHLGSNNSLHTKPDKRLSFFWFWLKTFRWFSPPTSPGFPSRTTFLLGCFLCANFADGGGHILRRCWQRCASSFSAWVVGYILLLIGSMGLVYLPLFYHKNQPTCIGKRYHSHGSYGFGRMDKNRELYWCKKMKHLKTLKHISTKQDWFTHGKPT